MTRETMKQALEALTNAYWPTNSDLLPAHNIKECAEAITALRQALEQQPAGEPVMWVTVENGVCVSTRSADFKHIKDGQYQLYTGPLSCEVVGAVATLEAIGYVNVPGDGWVSPQPADGSAQHWHDLYRAKCQELHDERARLGAQIEALEQQPADEPVGRVVSANCEYATVQWLKQTSAVGGGDPKNSRSWPITGDAIYTRPQPAAQWVGLTDEDIALFDWESFKTKKDCSRAIEQALKDKNT